jgi:hypothetical protein
MSNGVNTAEALLNNFELKVTADYGSTSHRHPSDVGQEIPDAPESVEEPIIEAGNLFYEGLENAHSFAEDEELDEAEKYFEQAFNKYEQAVDAHLDYKDAQELVDVDLVIDQALDGEIDEQSVIEAAGLPSNVIDDLQSDQSHVRRNMEQGDAYQFLEESDYDTETVVRENYLQGIREAQTEVDQGIEEIRSRP